MLYLRFIFVTCLVVLLSGCGSGGTQATGAASPRFRSASPLTFSVRQQPHEMTVRFTGLAAQTRGQVRILLQPTFDTTGFGGDDVAADEPLDVADPQKTVRFYDLTPGTYRLEARDGNDRSITQDVQGKRITVTVTE